MTESNEKKETREERAELLRRRQAARNQARVRRVRRIMLILAVAAAVLVIVLVSALVRRHRTKTGANTKKSSASAQQEQQAFSGNEVLHLSFPRLLVNRAQGASEAGAMTVDEFNRILEELYGDGYMLVDLRALSERDEDGVYHIGEITLPQGRKPLVLSQRDLYYADSAQSSTGTEADADGSGADAGRDTAQRYASGIEVTPEGALTNLYQDENGGTRTGTYDVITCVDAFIDRHPDFAADDVRGVLAVTGENGLLGYADPSSDECQNVINALLEEGWLFASNSYYGVSYGTEQSLFEADAALWQEEIAAGLGRTEILVLPGRADIGNRSPYTPENLKYRILSDQGFRCFCIDDSSSLTWMQAGDGFVRQSIHEVGSYAQFQALMQEGLESFIACRAAEEQAAEQPEEQETPADETETDDTEDEADDSVQIIEEDPI